MALNPTWNNMYSPIAPTHLAAADSVAYITNGPSVYYYDNATLSWEAGTKPTTVALTDLGASSDGSLIAVDSTGTYLYSASVWTTLYISAYTTSSAAIGDANDQLIVDTSGAVTKSVYGINTALATGPIKVSATSGLNNIWGVGSSGTVYNYSPTTATWTSISGKTLAQVHVSLSTIGSLQIVGVDSLGKAWSYNGSTWYSIGSPSTGDKFTSIQAGAGFIWAVLASGAVYRGSI